MNNKEIFASNLRKYMELRGKSRNDISDDLGISYFTITAWVNGTKYPRMDKVELLANYFGINKSDLIEKERSTTEAAVDEEIIKAFNSLSLEKQKQFRDFLRYLLTSPEN